MSAWSFRVKGGQDANWAEVGVSRHNSDRVVLRVGDGASGNNRRVSLRPDQARLLRRYLTQALRDVEAFAAAAERGRKETATAAAANAIVKMGLR